MPSYLNLQCFNDIKCGVVSIMSSGTTNIATENFDNFTSVLIFFLSLSQTLFLLTSYGFLNNYSNNSFLLRLADSLVYIADPNGKHYNFKDGPALFLVCLFHKHFLVQLLDDLLYRFFQTTTRRLFSIRAQMAMDMIDYGERTLTDSTFYT